MEIIGILAAILILASVGYCLFVFISFLIRKTRGVTFTSDKINWLKGEIPVWNQNHIITNEQGEAMLNHYSPLTMKEFKKTNLLKLLTLIGSILLGVGVILFVAANWGRISHLFETIIILTITFGTFFLGYYFSYMKKGYSNLGKGLIFASSIMWGATIALLSQMYQIPISDNWIIFVLWAIPILPIGIFLESSPTFVLSSILLLSWNISFNIGINAVNYYYLALAFILLLPISKKNKLHYILNTIAILIASFFGIIFKLNFFNFLIPIGFILYYFLIDRKEIFLVCASITSLFWIFTFNQVFQNPNYFFIPILIVLLYLAYLNKYKFLLTTTLISFVFWFNYFNYYFLYIFYNEFPHDSLFSIMIILNLLLGVIIYLSGSIQNNKVDYVKFGDIFKVIGYFVTLLTIYILSFLGFLHNNYFKNIQNLFLLKDSVVSIVLIVILGFISLFLLFYNLFNKKIAVKPEKYLSTFLFIFTAESLFILFNSNLTIIHIVIMNTLLLSISIFSVIYGYNNKNSWIFNTGVGIFIVFVITRYFDYFWRLLDRSLFFIIGGILLIGGSVLLDKERKDINKRVKENE